MFVWTFKKSVWSSNFEVQSIQPMHGNTIGEMHSPIFPLGCCTNGVVVVYGLVSYNGLENMTFGESGWV